MSKALLASVFALAAAVPVLSLSGCSPEVPANPTYEKDVKPILMARCVRCHDETFREEMVPGYQNQGPPRQCHLNRYPAMGDCTPAGLMMPGACSYGAGMCGNSPALGGSLIAVYAIASADNGFAPPMPPAPADKLSDWEQDVLRVWINNVGADGMPLP